MARRITPLVPEQTSLSISLDRVLKLGREASYRIGRGWLLALPISMLLVLFLLPLAIMVRQSFSGEDGTLSTYISIATNPALFWPLVYTFRTAASVTVTALLISYPVAYVLSGMTGRWLNIAVALILIPFWTSTVIRTYAWMVLVQRNGIVNDMLVAAGLVDRPLRLIGSDPVVQIAMVHLMLPFMLLPLLSSFRGIDRLYLRAASVLGANPLRQFRHVFLPLSMPGVTAGCALVFISSLGFYVTPALLGGSQQMMSVVIEQQASRLLNWPMASALGTVLLVITAAMFFAYERAISATSRQRGKK